MGIWFNIEKSHGVFVARFKLALSIYTGPQSFQVIRCKLIYCGSHWANKTSVMNSAYGLHFDWQDRVLVYHSANCGTVSELGPKWLWHTWHVWTPRSDITKQKLAQREKTGAIQTEWKDSEGIRCARCGILRDFTYPGLTEDLWSTGRRVHSLTPKGRREHLMWRESSSLEMEDRVCITLCHLISLRMEG